MTSVSPNLWTLSPTKLESEYRILCKKYHPDRNKTEDTTELFKTINTLYEDIKEHRKNPLHIDFRVSISELFHGCIKDIIVTDCDQDNPDILPITIPMGTIDGTIITLITKQYKLVHVKIKEINDTKFLRDGYNLIIHLDITLTQALLGDPIVMGHFNEVLKIPVQIPHTNYRHIIPGKGMPIPNSQALYGDLYVLYNVIFPDNISSDFSQDLLEATY